MVDADLAGERLDRFVVRSISSTTRSLVLDAITRGDVLINGRKAAKGKKVAAGQEVTVRNLLERADIRVQPNSEMALDVIHEDDVLLVLDKPANVPVHPLKPDETGTLANALIARYPDLQEVGDDPLFPALVHRIDTDTSGIVIAAKTPEAYGALRDAFRSRQVRKEYIALVHGKMEGAGRLEHVLEHDPARRGRMRVVRPDRNPSGERPMRAITDYAVTQSFSGYTLLDVRIPTGVTHQIRCQLAAEGHPVVGDRVYGDESAETLGLDGQFLHAAAVEIPHPRTGLKERFSSALPGNLKGALKRLSR